MTKFQIALTLSAIVIGGCAHTQDSFPLGKDPAYQGGHLVSETLGILLRGESLNQVPQFDSQRLPTWVSKPINRKKVGSGRRL